MSQHSTSKLYQRLILLFMISSWPALAWPTAKPVYVYGGVELSRWLEQDASSRRLLSEQGARLNVKAEWEDFIPRLGRFNISSQFYRGILNYDGQTQSIANAQANGVFIASKVEYTGLNTELEGLFPLFQTDVQLLITGGWNAWNRYIRSTQDSQNNTISGATEDYQIFYTRLGLVQNNTSPLGHSQIQLGLMYPLKTSERAAGIDPTLHPGRSTALFARYRIELNNDSHTRITFYYDGLRLSASPVVTDQFGTPWRQPESQMDTFGIMFGRPF